MEPGQAVFLEAGGLNAAPSEEGMRRLNWLQVRSFVHPFFKNKHTHSI